MYKGMSIWLCVHEWEGMREDSVMEEVESVREDEEGGCKPRRECEKGGWEGLREEEWEGIEM